MKLISRILILIVLFVSIGEQNTMGQCSSTREADSLMLVKLYNSTEGANWTTKTNWLSSNPINTWAGRCLSKN